MQLLEKVEVPKCVTKVAVSEDAVNNAFRIRDAILAAWLWNTDKMGNKIGALERLPVSVDLFERTGISHLRREDFWFKVGSAQKRRVTELMRKWKKFWVEQKEFRTGKAYEGKLPVGGEAIKQFAEAA